MIENSESYRNVKGNSFQLFLQTFAANEMPVIHLVIRVFQAIVRDYLNLQLSKPKRSSPL